MHVTGTTWLGGGYITTARGQTYAGPVTIANHNALFTSLGGDVHFLSTLNPEAGQHFGVTIDARHGDIQFGGDVGGLEALGYLTANAGPSFGKVITINADRITALGDIRLNPDGVEFVPDVATIAAPDGGVTIHSLDGRVIMGQNNKLTALETARSLIELPLSWTSLPQGC